MNEDFLVALAPIVEYLETLDPASADAAAMVNARFPVDSPEMQVVAAMYEAGLEAGWLCDRDGGPGVRYSRVGKKIGPAEFSIDAVSMDKPGLGHTHINGEFDLCFSVDGDPRFDGHKEGWTVFPPGSWHVPTVTGGRMNILYFLPGGAIKFGPKPE